MLCMVGDAMLFNCYEKSGGGESKENSYDMTMLLFNDIKILKNTIAHQSQQS